MTPKEYVSKFQYFTFYHKDPEMTVWHRERGLPAWECYNGDEAYLENNARHKLDSVAYDWCRHKFHYLNGKRLFGK